MKKLLPIVSIIMASFQFYARIIRDLVVMITPETPISVGTYENVH